MAAAGLEGRTLSYEHLLAFDQLHIGGVEQTRAMAQAAGINASHHVLDIGCGIGGAARVIAAECGASVVAVDRSEAYIDVARALTRMVGLGDRIACEIRSAPGLALSDGSCDVAWLQLVLMNVEHKAALYREIRKLLRPGGRLAIFDVVKTAPDAEIDYPVIWADDRSESHLVTIEAHRVMLADAGFGEVRVTDYTAVALEWYERVRARRTASRSPLSTGLLISGDAGLKSRHVQKALRSGQLKAMQLIARPGA